MPSPLENVPETFEDWRLPRASRSLRIAMLLTNPCTNDSRVIKEAEALAGMGHQVVVFCQKHASAPRNIERRNGVLYYRVSMFADTVAIMTPEFLRTIQSGLSDILRCLAAVFLGGICAVDTVFYRRRKFLRADQDKQRSCNGTSMLRQTFLVFHRRMVSISKLMRTPVSRLNQDAPLKSRRNGTSERFVNANHRVTSPKWSSQRVLGSSEGGVNQRECRIFSF